MKFAIYPLKASFVKYPYILSSLCAQKQDTFQRLNCKTNIKSKFHQESFSKVWNLSSQMELGKGCLQFNKEISRMLTQGYGTMVALYWAVVPLTG